MSSAEDWVRSNLHVISESGDEIICECPSCGSAKLWINLKKGSSICYKGCYRGSVAYLIANVEGCSMADARARMVKPAPRTADDLRDRLDSLSPVREVMLVDQPLPEDFSPCFDGRNYHVPAYVEDPLPGGRGLDDDALRRHGIGYALEGKYRDRVIVPIHCDQNRTFLSRIMGKPSEFGWRDKTTGKRREPSKYLSPRGANMGSFLYWYDNTPKGVDVLFVVEGVFDAIRLIGLGFYAVANFGKRATTAQIALLARLAPKSIVCLYDAGATSESKLDAWRVKSKIRRTPVLAAELTGDDDPDLLGFREGRRGVLDVLKAAKPVKSQLDSIQDAIKILARRSA